MTTRETSLAVLCDGLRLECSACVPTSPRGVVVLLHGIPSSAPPDPNDEGYPGLARVLGGERWAAVWADMRGVRESPGFFSIEGWVRDALALVEAARSLDGARGVPMALVGFSAGGAVAVEAVARGAPVDGLAVFAAPAQWLSFAADAGAGAKRVTDDAGMRLSPEALADPAAWAAEFLSVTAENSIGSVGVPTLIVHGTDDDVVPVAHARRLAERALDAELHIVDGATHALRQDARVVRLLLDWLDRTL